MTGRGCFHCGDRRSVQYVLVDGLDALLCDRCIDQGRAVDVDDLCDEIFARDPIAQALVGSK